MIKRKHWIEKQFIIPEYGWVDAKEDLDDDSCAAVVDVQFVPTEQRAHLAIVLRVRQEGHTSTCILKSTIDRARLIDQEAGPSSAVRGARILGRLASEAADRAGEALKAVIDEVLESEGTASKAKEERSDES